MRILSAPVVVALSLALLTSAPSPAADGSFDERLIDATVHTAAAQAHVYLLVRPEPTQQEQEEEEDAPADTLESSCEPQAERSLLRLSLKENADVERFAIELPPYSSALQSLDIDADGVPELLVLAQNGIYRVRFEDRQPAATELWWSAPELIALGGGPLLPVASGQFVAQDLRAVYLLESGSVANGEGAIVRQELPLPSRAFFNAANGFRLIASPIAPLGPPEEPARTWVSRPRDEPAQRQSASVIRYADGALTLERVWMRSDRPEQNMETTLRELNGELSVIALRNQSDRVAVFGEKRLQVMPLRSDRTRMGHPPSFSVDSRVNLWQRTRLTTPDLNGDGREDLVLAYYKGLRKSRLVLDAYISTESGWRKEPRTTAFNVKEAQTGLLQYGTDENGDGHPDLMLSVEGRIDLYLGEPLKKKGRWIAERPRESAPVPWTGTHDRFRVDFQQGNRRWYSGTDSMLETRGEGSEIDWIVFGRDDGKTHWATIRWNRPAS